jgi:hypothetical protein
VFRTSIFVFSTALALGCGTSAWADCFVAKRYGKNPLITFSSSSSLGKNINGPSVIKVPKWLPSSLGKYYMYFAHHRGKFIRLAYANHPEGPWKIYEPGTLKLPQATAFRNHIASPDVHIDNKRQLIRMYFHGRAVTGREQKTGVAWSRDGITFTPVDTWLGRSYFRVFKYKGYYYAIDRQTFLNRSKSPDSRWKARSVPLFKPIRPRGYASKRMFPKVRHVGVFLDKDLLYIFFSRRGDAPERISWTSIKLTDSWLDWKVGKSHELLRSEKKYEGARFPAVRSKSGAKINVHQLRDPFIFEDDGRLYLYYTIAGEMGIAVARLQRRATCR